MMAVNLGTRGPDAARRLVEYCNFPAGTKFSDMRRAHGWEKPHDVKFWCLGNEVDGPWQMGAKTATEYGRVATEAAKLMKLVDPTIELAAVGSSGQNMPTFGAWEREVLEHTFDHVEFISLHTYLNDYAGDTPAFLASPDRMDGFIEEVVAIADSVAKTRGSDKRIHLSFDEWNVWYRTRRGNDRKEAGWPIAPHILEEVYSMKDALAFGGMCVSLLNHADRVKCACLAQLVNAIAPILTAPGGPAWRQTIFWPFADFAKLGRGTVLKAAVGVAHLRLRLRRSARCDGAGISDEGVPFLKAAAVHSEADRTLTLFLLNRSLDTPMTVAVDARGFGGLALGQATTLRHDDLDAINTKDDGPVAPVPLDGVVASEGGVSVTIPPASWNVVRLNLA